MNYGYQGSLEPIVDAEGRLLDPVKIWESKQVNIPGDPDDFIADWVEQRKISEHDWNRNSKVVWPSLDYNVKPIRLDVYEHAVPLLQQATSDPKRSLQIRNTKGWEPLYSCLFVDQPGQYTKSILIEAAAPPKRNRYRPKGSNNHRDLSDWTLRETFEGYTTATNVPGAQDFAIDWADSPDRYWISREIEPAMGWRRMFRFAGYPLTQYYIMEKLVFHDCLEAEGGRALTCDLERGNKCFVRKGWKLKGSFFAFDRPISGANKYTVYYMDEPFTRILIAIGEISHIENWQVKFTFYAFDVPAPGTCLYELQHCVRSIHSTAASVSRHRLSAEDPKNPYEFRMNIYVLPALLDTVTLTTDLNEIKVFG